MSKHRKQYDREFKLRLVNQIISGQKTPNELGAELNIDHCIISRWKREFEDDPENAFPGAGWAKHPERVKGLSLRERLQQVTAERDTLRKAIALIYKREFKIEDIETL